MVGKWLLMCFLVTARVWLFRVKRPSWQLVKDCYGVQVGYPDISLCFSSGCFGVISKELLDINGCWVFSCGWSIASRVFEVVAKLLLGGW